MIQWSLTMRTSARCFGLARDWCQDKETNKVPERCDTRRKMRHTEKDVTHGEDAIHGEQEAGIELVLLR